MRDNDSPELDGGFLAEFGAKLIENGYDIVPINAGKKAPLLEGWTQLKSTKEELKKWLSNKGGYLETGGAGITSKRTPAVDIDVRDKDVADQVEAFVREHIGAGLVRVGEAPRRLMVFRADEPFTKMSSKKYQDEWGDQHQVEILGDGQQFVAYHIHPKTKLPYAWPNNDGPAVTPHDELVTITKAQAKKVVDFFDQIAGQMNDWKVVQKGRSARAGETDDGIFGNLKNGSTLIEVRDALMDVSDVDSYDVWVGVGMALHFEYDASEEALDLWKEWSSASLEYDEDQVEKKWETFSEEDNGKVMLGVSFIFDLRKKEMMEKAEAELPRLKLSFQEAKTKVEWEAAAAAVRKSEIGPLDRADIAALAKKKIDLLLDNGLPVATVRKMLAYEQAKNEKLPSWLQGWVYDTEADLYLHTETKMRLSKQGFAARFDRFALTKKDKLEGKSSPSTSADDLALNYYKIEMVHGTRYGPGEPPIYEEDGLRVANTYVESLIPKEPDIVTPRDKANIKRIKAHIAHLLRDPKEQRMFLDWLSWVVQHPGERVRHAILLQGTQGDGKSFFGQMMRYVMGRPNVRFLSASVLESNFNGWAVGQCVTCIEEVRLLSDDRFKILNQIKDIITNPDVSVTFKGKDPVTLKNTTNYLLFTNYQDALPLEDSDRRYLVFFSWWQQKHELMEFMEANPDYYVKLYTTLQESTPAIRQWLMEHEQLESFDPNGFAPETTARAIMVDAARPQFIKDLREVIREKQHPWISEEILSLDTVENHFESNGYVMPQSKTASFMLTHAGYVLIGRPRVEGKLMSIYSKYPRKFMVSETSANEYSSKKIREFLENSKKQVDWSDPDEL